MIKRNNLKVFWERRTIKNGCHPPWTPSGIFLTTRLKLGMMVRNFTKPILSQTWILASRKTKQQCQVSKQPILSRLVLRISTSPKPLFMLFDQNNLERPTLRKSSHRSLNQSQSRKKKLDHRLSRLTMRSDTQPYLSKVSLITKNSSTFKCQMAST